MKTKPIPLHRRVWLKIRLWQKLNNASDESLARYLNMSVRTLREYDNNAGNLSLERVESFMSATGLTLDTRQIYPVAGRLVKPDHYAQALCPDADLRGAEISE